MRQYAYDIVYGTLEKGGHSDELFHGVLRDNPHLEKMQKNFLKRLSFGTIERAIEMDARIDLFSRIPTAKMEPPVRTVLRMALYEICYMEQVTDAAACHEAVQLVREKAGERPTGFVNGILREYLRCKDKVAIKESWQELSVPRELFEHLVSQYGAKTAKKIAKSFLDKSGEVTIHLDKNKISADDYDTFLDREGITWQKGAYWEDARILSHVPDVKLLPGYEEGLFFVQDESSMLPVACAGIKPGDVVADICSAPGGKSIHALIELAGRGRLTSRDVSQQKVELVKENIRRMGYTNVSAKVWDARKPDSDMEGKADVILADVPCSGIGIIGRKPEIKYHAMENALGLAGLQREICEASISMLKPGGIFIYSTCTINHAENEENVQWLESRFGLVRESLDSYLPKPLCNRMTAEGMLQMLPGIQKSDGFFAARLRKKAM